MFRALLVLSLFSINSLFSAEVLPRLFKRVRPAVATVRAYDSDGNLLIQGTGFFIDRKGHLITSLHVVADAVRIEIRSYDGRTYIAHGVSADDEAGDIAMLTVEGDKMPPYALKVRPNYPEVGQKVVVVGSPLGFDESISDGIISGLRHVSGMGSMIQMTAPISAGSSGSPVLNLRGEVVGVARSQRGEGQNLNFAVPGVRVLALESEDGTARGTTAMIAPTCCGSYKTPASGSTNPIDRLSKTAIESR